MDLSKAMLELCLGYAGQVGRAEGSVGEGSDLRAKGTSCSEGEYLCRKWSSDRKWGGEVDLRQSKDGGVTQEKSFVFALGADISRQRDFDFPPRYLPCRAQTYRPLASLPPSRTMTEKWQNVGLNTFFRSNQSCRKSTNFIERVVRKSIRRVSRAQ